ncbi:MAG TPA: methyltransferase [Humisphaera sp.]
MTTAAAPFPPSVLDPTPIFEHFRGSYGTELLTAAVAHFDLFSHLAAAPMSLEALRGAIGLHARGATVLVTALRAMGLVGGSWPDRLELTPLARGHLVKGTPHYVGDYLGLAAQSPGVVEMARLLKANAAKVEKTAGGADASMFTFRDGVESAMDDAAAARKLTLALAGRAKIVAPALATNLPLAGTKVLLDAGGGTGIYSLALVAANPGLRAVVWDRAEVLKVAREFAEAAGLLDRVELRPGDMFADPVPAGCDAVLLSNILHDWDVPECDRLVGRLAAALPAGGRLVVHDVFLNDAMDGPLAITHYSAALFTQTEGRAYSGAEYRRMMTTAGLEPAATIVPTAVHCGALVGTKR